MVTVHSEYPVRLTKGPEIRGQVEIESKHWTEEALVVTIFTKGPHPKGPTVMKTVFLEL